jgi:hypothetical protein
MYLSVQSFTLCECGDFVNEYEKFKTFIKTLIENALELWKIECLVVFTVSFSLLVY